MMDDFLKSKFVVNCKSEDQAKEFLDLFFDEHPEFLRHGWEDGRTRFECCQDKTCYGIDNYHDNLLLYGTPDSWTISGMGIVGFEEFMSDSAKSKVTLDDYYELLSI